MGYFAVPQGGGGGGDGVTRAQRASGWAVGGSPAVYRSEIDAVPGSASMTIIAHVRLQYLLAGGERFILGTNRRFAGPGFGLSLLDTRPNAIVWDGTSTLRQSGTAGAGWLGSVAGGGDTRDHGNNKDAIVHMTYSGALLSCYVNGELFRALAVVDGGFSPATGFRMYLGATNDNAGAPTTPFDGGIAGVAMRQDGVLSAAQILAQSRAWLDRGYLDEADLAGYGLQNLWSFQGLGAAPAVLEDRIGGADLERVGALDFESTRFVPL